MNALRVSWLYFKLGVLNDQSGLYADIAGNIGKRVLTIHRDTIAPALSVISPLDGSHTYDTLIEIKNGTLIKGEGPYRFEGKIEPDGSFTVAWSQGSFPTEDLRWFPEIRRLLAPAGLGRELKNPMGPCIR